MAWRASAHPQRQYVLPYIPFSYPQVCGLDYSQALVCASFQAVNTHASVQGEGTEPWRQWEGIVCLITRSNVRYGT